MSARNKKFISMYVWIGFLFAAAIYLDNLAFRSPSLELLASLVACIMFICVFAFWMMSVKWRCMHLRIRNYTMAVGALSIFWLVLTLLQNYFAVMPLIKRRLWYLSYLPIVVIPLMAVYAASCIAQPDTRPVKKKYKLLSLPTAAFCLLVMTNELHGLVFDVHIYETHDLVREHSPLCVLMFVWAAILELIAISTLIAETRSTGLHWVRNIAPLSFFALGAGYVVLLLTGVVGENAVTMSTVLGFFHLAICESCLFLRLLPTNFYYRQFFENADIGMQLTDADDEVKIRSHRARVLDADELGVLKEKGSMYEDGFEIYRKEVQGGFLIYEKDVHRIQMEIEKLETAASELKETDNYIVEQQRLRIRQNRLDEKERIYNEISHIIAPSLDKIDRLLADIDNLEYEERRRTIWRINLLGTYIKRRANLELRRKESPSIFGSEISQCLTEFAASLGSMGIASNGYFDPKSAVSLDSAILILDIYAYMVEHNFLNIKNISVIQSRREGRLSFLIEAVGRSGIKIADDKLSLFRNYAGQHDIEMSVELEEISNTVSCTVVTDDGEVRE